MRVKIKKAILLGYTLLLCVSIAVAGICLIAQCLLLYRSGAQPYSTESVAKAFSQIAAPVYFCGVMVVLSLFLKHLFPVPRKKAEKNYPFILRRLQQSTDLSACPRELQEEIQKLRRRQRLIRILSWLFLAVGGIVFLSHGANPDNFHQSDINASMVKAMYILLPSMLLPFGFGVFAAYYGKRNMQKEIELLKGAPTDAKTAISATSQAQRPVVYLRFCILAIAVFLICFGYFIGGAADVLTKAVNICTECIGLG